DPEARNRRLNFLERPAIGMTWFQIEGVHLARTAVHPQQDTGTAPPRIRGEVGGHALQPARQGVADDPGRRQPQPITAGVVNGTSHKRNSSRTTPAGCEARAWVSG